MKDDKFRCCCFTSYQIESIYTHIQEIENVCDYGVWQLEICPDTRRIHVQGYVELSVQSTLGCIKKKLHDDTVHIERRRGTQKQAIDYCKKAESSYLPEWRVEFGNPRVQGERNELWEDYEVYRQSGKLSDISITNMIRYGKAFQSSLLNTIEPRTKAPIVEVFYGDEESFLEQYYKNGVYIYNDDSEWGGYKGEKEVIYNSPTWKYRGIQLFSKFPYKTKILYNYVELNYDRIYVRYNGISYQDVYKYITYIYRNGCQKSFTEALDKEDNN